MPDLTDMTIKDVFRVLLFQEIYMRRQAEKAATLRMLRDASLSDEKGARDGYKDVVDLIVFGEIHARRMDTKKVAEFMEQESKKRYIVTPATTGLRMRGRGRGKR